MKVYLVTCTMNWFDSNEVTKHNVGIYSNVNLAESVIEDCEKMDETIKWESFSTMYEIETYELDN